MVFVEVDKWGHEHEDNNQTLKSPCIFEKSAFSWHLIGDDANRAPPITDVTKIIKPIDLLENFYIRLSSFFN